MNNKKKKHKKVTKENQQKEQQMLRITFSQINQNYSYITNKQTNKHKLVTQFLLLFYLVNITLLYSETPREAYIKTIIRKATIFKVQN